MTVSLLIPLNDQELSLFFYTGRMPLRTKFAGSLAEDVDFVYACSGQDLIGPFAVTGTGSGELICKAEEAVLKFPYREVKCPLRIRNEIIREALPPVPEYESVTGDPFTDGLIASSSGGTITFESGNWQLIRHCASRLSAAGISYSMDNASEIRIGGSGLPDISVSDGRYSDGFMAGFLSSKTVSGKVFGCPEELIGSFGSRAILFRDPYGNVSVSPMSSDVYPFGIDGICRKDPGNIKGIFAFSASESAFLYAMEYSGYAVKCLWSDSAAGMYSFSGENGSYDIILVPEMRDGVFSGFKGRRIADGALVAVLRNGPKYALFGSLKPLSGVTGCGWRHFEGFFTESGPEMPQTVRDELKRGLKIIWGGINDGEYRDFS
ncbi:MAG: hypothetical protein J5494_08250 [Candidatus Methanomethylophilaceae archaeon]|nr:hypothetical protein [Candidatus Methanomethylophilaceae archaeon]